MPFLASLGIRGNWPAWGQGPVFYQLMMNGPNSAYALLYDYYKKGRILVNGFSGLPTETLALLGRRSRDQ